MIEGYIGPNKEMFDNPTDCGKAWARYAVKLEGDIEQQPRVIALVARVKYLEGLMRKWEQREGDTVTKVELFDALYKYGSDK